MKETEAVWNTFSEDILQYFRGRVKDKSVAEDLRQEVFVRIHENLGTLRDPSRISHWISVIARNVLASHWKKEEPVYETKDFSSEMDTGPTILENMAEKCVSALLATLPDKYGKPLMLSDLQGVRQKELAAQLNLSYSGAKSRVQRGREMLRKAIVDCCRPEFNGNGELISSRCVEEDASCQEGALCN